MGLLSRKSKEPKKYTSAWLESLSDEELKIEREKVRQDYSFYSREVGADWRTMLDRFDDEMTRRYKELHKYDPPRKPVHWTDANRWEKD